MIDASTRCSSPSFSDGRSAHSTPTQERGSSLGQHTPWPHPSIRRPPFRQAADLIDTNCHGQSHKKPCNRPLSGKAQQKGNWIHGLQVRVGFKNYQNHGLHKTTNRHNSTKHYSSRTGTGTGTFDKLFAVKQLRNRTLVTHRQITNIQHAPPGFFAGLARPEKPGGAC